MKNRYLPSVLLVALLSEQAYATDPLTSVYQYTTPGTQASKVLEDKVDKMEKAKKEDDKAAAEKELGWVQRTLGPKWRAFYFDKEDPFFGGVTVGFSGDSQQAKINYGNYNIDVGGDIRLPFQLYYTTEADTDSSMQAQQDSNTQAILDPESGFAVKFPMYFMYQDKRSDGGWCDFLEDEHKDDDSDGQNTVTGFCGFGADLTFNFKELQNMDGSTETAAGQTLRLGAAMLFPIKTFDDSTAGFLSLSARFLISHTDIDNPEQLFTPVLDGDGEPVAFDDTITSGEFELKFSINQKVAISARWLTPLDNKDYFDDVFQLNIEAKYQ